MPVEQVARKLAAILVADVVAYSRLASADEEGTLARLRVLQSDLIDPTISGHHGRTVKRTGDGVLVEFRSVVDAVRCAIEMQYGMVERNVRLPAEQRIDFRIGIHLGDVVQEKDNDLMGDGVNIAARLESVAEPGGICLSEDAYRQVRGKIPETFRDLGDQQLKNLEYPVRTYRVILDGNAAKFRTGFNSCTRRNIGVPKVVRRAFAVSPDRRDPGCDRVAHGRVMDDELVFLAAENRDG